MRKLKKPTRKLASPGKSASPRKLVKSTLKENAAKLLLDVGKLVFASIFLGSSLRSELPQDILTIVGFAVAVVFFVIGLFLDSKEKKPENMAIRRRRRRKVWTCN